MGRRELCVETESGHYVRWLSVSSSEEMRGLLVSKKAAKFHTGAVFTCQPRLRRAVQAAQQKLGEDAAPMQAELRELVFDVDCTDYSMLEADKNDIGSCDRAIPIVMLGMKVVARLLRSMFGFENTLLTYSGLKGAHLSVHDKRACALSDDERGAVVAALQPSKFDKSGFLDFLSKSPDVEDVVDEIIMQFWAGEQGCVRLLETTEARIKFTSLLSCAYLQKAVTEAGPFDDAVHYFNALIEASETSKFRDSNTRIIFAAICLFLWPRLDVEVSKKRNHLSKAVFSLHSKTKRVCVPVELDGCETFNPASCPTANGLLLGNDTSAFQTSLHTLDRFIARLEESDTEKWERPRLLPSSAPVFSFVNRKRMRGYEPSVQDFATTTARVCCLFYRRLVGVSSLLKPGTLALFVDLDFKPDSMFVLPPGYSPPCQFQAPFEVGSVVQAIKKASKEPLVESIVCNVACCAMFASRLSFGYCRTRIARLVEASRRNKVKTYNSVCTAWDERAIKSWLVENLETELTEKLVFLGQ